MNEAEELEWMLEQIESGAIAIGTSITERQGKILHSLRMTPPFEVADVKVAILKKLEAEE